MAKKSSKRRRQGAKSQTVFAPSSTSSTTQAEKTQAATVAPAAKNSVDFVLEYFYVYQDLRSVLLVGILMFIVLVGLSFAI